MANYTVKSGDSLSKIARDVLGNMSLWPDIAALNNIVKPYTIFPGQVLRLPGVGVLPGQPATRVRVPIPPPITTMPVIAPPGAPPMVPMPPTPAMANLMDFVKRNKWLLLGGISVLFLLPMLMKPKRRRRRRR